MRLAVLGLVVFCGGVALGQGAGVPASADPAGPCRSRVTSLSPVRDGPQVAAPAGGTCRYVSRWTGAAPS
jgi:hypothetical protein